MKVKGKITVVVVSPYLERPLRSLDDVLAERSQKTGRRFASVAQASMWRGTTWTRWLNAS